MKGRSNWRGRRGIAAVEFALVMPVLLVLFIGTFEVLTLYRAEGKVNALAFNVAQMVSVEPQSAAAQGVNATSLQDICNGAILGLAPFPPAGLVLDIASVTMEQGPSGLPAINTASARAYAAHPAFDVWEQTFYVPSGAATCSPGTLATVTPMGAGAAISLATTNPPIASAAAPDYGFYGNTSDAGQVEVPCDNMIIVKASTVYPGLTGLIVTSRPVLSQTAYTRWRYGSELEQIICPGCTQTPAVPLQYCNANNTAMN